MVWFSYAKRLNSLRLFNFKEKTFRGYERSTWSHVCMGVHCFSQQKNEGNAVVLLSNRFKRKGNISSIPATISFRNALCCGGQSLKRTNKKLDFAVVWLVWNKIKTNVRGRWTVLPCCCCCCCCFPPSWFVFRGRTGWGLSVQRRDQYVFWSCLAGDTAALRHRAAQHQQPAFQMSERETSDLVTRVWLHAVQRHFTLLCGEKCVLSFEVTRE